MKSIRHTFGLHKKHSVSSVEDAKTAFLSRVSHDIRTPLNGIIGLTLLAEKIDNPPETEVYLKKIETSSNFLLSLVNDILDMTKMESRRITLHPEPYPTSEFKEYLDAVIQPLCDRKGIQFLHKHGPEEEIVMVDKLRINQIFFNLLSNAVKYTPSGGRVTFTVENSEVKDKTLIADYVVSDNGIGMSKEYQKHLYEAFAQEDNGMQMEKEGYGLGLAIVKNLVDLMHGTIAVESNVGEGTTFRVHLPLSLADTVVIQESINNKENEVDLTNKKILIVEDNDINAEILTAFLEEKKMIIMRAENGEQAVDFFRDTPEGTYDAILMDIRMPVMDGIQATKCIRALDRPDASTIPIVAMTANAFDEDIQADLAAGMNAHVSKPLNPDIVYKTLNKLL